jgi:hypothetical protein
MRKFCVFCGKRPETKTREHVIPKWLIAFTGDPKRQSVFGPFWNEIKKRLETRSYSFDSFAFPACEVCNRTFSELEPRAKGVVLSVLREQLLSSGDLSVLLTWLDKVRVGLWLAAFVMTHNLALIAPQFAIGSRVDRCDRMVLIYKSDYVKHRLRFVGTTAPAFQYVPSCFALIIDNHYFLNVSADFLLSKRLGLPYPLRMSYTNTPELEWAMTEGRERIAHPVVTLQYDPRCMQILQPMLNGRIVLSVGSYYDNHYVRSMIADHSKGIGKVFYYDARQLHEWSPAKSAWSSPPLWKDNHLQRVVGRQVLTFQNHLLRCGPTDRRIGHKGVSKEKMRFVRQQESLALEVNNMILHRLFD